MGLKADHNHLTRYIKPRGACPTCDTLHEEQDRKPQIKASVARAKEKHAETLLNLEDR